jgi:2'-5' RNA ligase
MPRLFFALQPPEMVSVPLIEAATPLITQLQSRAAPAPNLHATLCFVGAVEPEKVDSLRAAAATVRGMPCEFDFDALEYWDKPQVLCATPSRGESPEANALSVALRDAIVTAGFSPDIKPMRAHLTLARKIRAADAEKISWPQILSPGFVVRFDQFVLMESRRGEQGSIYSVIDSWPLYGTQQSRVIQ